MSESTFFTLAFIVYFLAALSYFAYLFSLKESRAVMGLRLAAAGLILHTLALVMRTVQSGHAPFTNMYESLSFLAWASVFAFIIVEWKFKVRRPGAYILLIVIALM